MNGQLLHDPAGAFAAGLMDAHLPVPSHLTAWNGSNPTRRYDVYRNNVMVSLCDALAETFPVCHMMVGDDFFRAMARAFLQAQPPATRVLTWIGAPFAAFVDQFEPAQSVPWLADLARLEMARVVACHAADAPPVPAARLQALLADAAGLADARLHLHPSVRRIDSPWAVAALWSAHQLDDAGRDARLSAIDPEAAVHCMVFRDDRDLGDSARLDANVPVCTLDAGAARFIDAVLAGMTLGEAAADALAHSPGLSLDAPLSLLLEYQLIVAIETGEDHARTSSRH